MQHRKVGQARSDGTRVISSRLRAQRPLWDGAEQSEGGQCGERRKCNFVPILECLAGAEGRREEWGRTKVHGWNDFDRVRCQNTMIGSLTRMGRRANRGERKAPSLGQKGRLALIRADRAPNQDFLGFVVRPSLFSSRTRTSQVKKPITHSLTLIHPSSFGSR